MTITDASLADVSAGWAGRGPGRPPGRDSGLGARPGERGADGRSDISAARYVRFDTPGGISSRDRFEYWRTWYGQAVDAPMLLDPLGRLSANFHASAEVLAAADVDLIEMRCGPAVGRWDREATEPAQRLRLVLLAPSPGGTGYWHGQELSLAHGCVALLGGTDGCWSVPAGLHGVQVNLPRAAFQVSDAELHAMNEPRLLRHDPILTTLIHPTMCAIAGHLDALTADTTELATIWTSLMNMLIRSLRRQDLDGERTPQTHRVQVENLIQRRLAHSRPGRREQRLTPRELAVLRLLATGATNKVIAAELGLTAKTVTHYSSAIYRKLDVRGRTEAVVRALREGVLDSLSP